MKVLFVTRGWPTAKNPMSGNFEAVQAKALAKRGLDVTVVYTRKKSISHLFDSKKVIQKECDGITVLYTTLIVTEIPHLKFTKYNKFDLLLRQLTFSRIYKHYRRINGDADVIHAHFINQAYDCKMVIDKYHIPFVITEHWSKLNFASVDSRVARMAKAYSWADKVICVSSALSDSLKSKFGIESVVLHNMVADSFFSEVKPEYKPFKDGITRFVSVGSLIGGKGYDVIINALGKMKHLPESQLTIIGGGREEQNLKTLAEQCGLWGKVIFTGMKTPEEVNQLIAQSDCFVLASRRETFGIVYIEAMAKGKPVIATVCGGPESFVNESNGVLIPVDDINATANAMDYMVENIEKYDSERIRNYCYENFSEEHISRKTIEIYNQVVEQYNK